MRHGRFAAARRPLQAVLPLLLLAGCAGPAPASLPSAPMPVIVDTDIGDDIDDAYALALVLRSPQLELDAVSASFGDTATRAALIRRLLLAAGRSDVPVLAGPPTAPGTSFTQRGFAIGGTATGAVFPDAVDGVLRRLRAAPAGRVTLVALAPLTTVGAMIRRDPASFRRLRQVMVMGGWIRHGYPPHPGQPANHEPEYNVASDPDGLRALLGSGVPVTLMPLDATQVPLRPADRTAMARGGALGAVLETLYGQWHRLSPFPDHPTLFDVVPVAWLLQPSICTPQPMRLLVTGTGLTTETPGMPNASVCLSVDAAAVRSMLDRAVGPAR